MKALPILMYHHVSPAPGLVTVSPGAFRAQIAALAEGGWRSAGLAEVEAFYRGQPLPEKTVVISFDDGYLDNYVHGHPVLAEFGFKAVLFVATGWLGDGPPRPTPAALPDHRQCKALIAAGEADQCMLRWSEMEAMAAAGTFEFHSHTHSHTRWDKTEPDVNARRRSLAADLALSRQQLEGRLGVASAHLCWPQGYHDADYREVAAEAGFRYLYTTEKRVNLRQGDPRFIGRIVTKEKDGAWLLSRTRLYANPWLGRAYAWLRGN